MKERNVMWTPSTAVGLEHLRLLEDSTGYFASSVVIGSKHGAPFSAWYSIRCDVHWRVQEVDAQLLHSGTNDKKIALLVDDQGHWLLMPGRRPFSELDGCIDVDLTATPFTNTLPIRRLALSVGQSAELLVAYIALPELDVSAVRQRYTCLETSEYGGLYRYEGLSTGFTRDIRVDADGLVINYPGLFQRVSN